MEKILDFTKKHWLVIVFVLIILGAFVLRTYNFSDWLYFKADQVRDAKLAVSAFENGPGELSLLGPRAAGTFLRLGPIFYYEEYISAKLFNSVEPHVFAFPDLLFSLLTIPIFFIFLRIFFSKRISILITILYSFSFIITQYSRFAWNPNQIPFWGLLFSLSLLKSYKELDGKKAGWWLVLAGLSYAIVSQLHFVAFVGFPIVAALFWVLYFPRKINWKYWVGAVATGIFIYIPVFLSDFYTSGDNLKQFIYAITAKTGDQALGFFETCKIIAISLFMFLTSFGHKEGVVSAWLGAFLVVAGITALIYFWKKEKKSRPFIYLVLIWFFVFIILQIKTNISLKPRFFMPIAVLPFIFWGTTLKVVEGFGYKFLSVVAYASFIVILLMNLSGIKMWFDYLGTQDISHVTRHIFIKQDDGKTFGQIKKAAELMAEKGRESGKRVCFYVGADYKRSYEYIFDVYYPDIEYDRMSKSIEDKEGCIYFSIATATDEAKKISNRYVDYFDFGDSYKVGTIAVWEIYPREKFINYNEKEDKTKKSYNEELEGIEEVDIVEEKIGIDVAEDKAEKEKTEKAPARLERVLWKHIFGG